VFAGFTGPIATGFGLRKVSSSVCPFARRFGLQGFRPSSRATTARSPVLDKVANAATEMPHCRTMRRLIRWLRRRYEADDEISFQGVEYDEETGKMKLKP
jgi:hypothetical protein